MFQKKASFLISNIKSILSFSESLSSNDSTGASIAYICKTSLQCSTVSVFETFGRFLSSRYFGLGLKDPTQLYTTIIKFSLSKRRHMRPRDTCLTDITQGPWLISGSLGVFSFHLFISSIHSCSSSASSYVIGPSEFELTFSPDVLLIPLLSLAASFFNGCSKLAKNLCFM